MTTESKTYPVTIKGEMVTIPSRGLWLVKWLLAFPHYICLIGLCIASFVVSVISFFAIVFTGKYPKSLFNFNLGVMRWGWRVIFYAFALGTDKYPPFSLDPVADYPADLEIAYPEKLSQGLVWVKFWLLAIPQYIIVGVFMGSAMHFNLHQGLFSTYAGWQMSDKGIGLVFILAIFAGFCLLFSQKYPAEIFKLVVGMYRWALRVAAYPLMRDEYPPFRFWDS
jgi:ABC-type multidrug transport system fused ATPase/permease subunit